MKRFAGRICIWLAMMLLVLMAPWVMAEESGRTRYTMDVTLTEKKLPVQRVRMEIEMQVDVYNDSEEEWTELCFRDYMHSYIKASSVGGMMFTSELEEAKCGEQVLETYMAEEDRSIIFVRLDGPIAPGGRKTIAIKYSATVPSTAQRSNYGSLTGALKKRTCELSQFYPMLAIWEDSTWQADPYFEEGECFYTRCADYEITLRLPEKYDVVASGNEERMEDEDGKAVWKITAENMRDVTIVASDEMEKLTGEACGVTVNSWFAPMNEDDVHGEVFLQTAMKAIEAFTAAYGAYPYDELDVVDSGISAGGMEAPGLIRINAMYSKLVAELPEDDSMAQMLAEEIEKVVVHEAAHEWFYGVVGNDQYNEAWLDESLASFSETVYWSYIGKNEETVDENMRVFSDLIYGSGGMEVDLTPAQLGEDYINAVYQRGASFLYQLERTMGEEFYAFMKEYYQAYSFREAHTEDFLDMLAPYIENNKKAQAVVRKYLTAAQELF